MSISQTFIDHPRVAFVISILIAFCGGLCLNTIPVAEYPEIAPTTIYVTASYPGASSEVIAEGGKGMNTKIINQFLFDKVNAQAKGLS